MEFCSDKINKRKAGIYCILNTENGRFYIGSTLLFWDRYKGHLNSLKRNDHHSLLLQRSFNKYGKDIFQFNILQIIDTDNKRMLRDIEQTYLDATACYSPLIGFNRSKIAWGADSPISKENLRRLLGRKIVAYNLDGTFFKQFQAIAEAAEELNIDGSGIGANCKGKIDRFKNWIWRYVDDSNPYLDQIEPYKYALIGVKRDLLIGPKIVATRKKNGSYGHSEEMKQHFRTLKLGTKASLETRQKQSKALMGRAWTKEARDNNDRARQKQIVGFDLFGYPTAYWESLKKCALDHKIGMGTMSTWINSGREYKGLYLVYLPKGSLNNQQELKAIA